jgi:hypothetical protein
MISKIKIKSKENLHVFRESLVASGLKYEKI